MGASNAERGLPEGGRGGITDAQRGRQVLPPRLSQGGSLGTTATLYFGQGDYLLNASNAATCQKLRQEILSLPGAKVTVNAYASEEGDAAYNQQLSEKRRFAVTTLLLPQPSPVVELSGRAYGESSPAASEDTKDPAKLDRSRQANRRVEILITPVAKTITPPPPESKPKTDSERLDEAILREVPEPKRRKNESLAQRNRRLLEWLWDKSLGRLTRPLPEGIRDWVKNKAISLAEEGQWKAVEDLLEQQGLSAEETKAFLKTLQAISKIKP